LRSQTAGWRDVPAIRPFCYRVAGCRNNRRSGAYCDGVCRGPHVRPAMFRRTTVHPPHSHSCRLIESAWIGALVAGAYWLYQPVTAALLGRRPVVRLLDIFAMAVAIGLLSAIQRHCRHWRWCFATGAVCVGSVCGAAYALSQVHPSVAWFLTGLVVAPVLVRRTGGDHHALLACRGSSFRTSGGRIEWRRFDPGASARPAGGNAPPRGARGDALLGWRRDRRRPGTHGDL